MLCTSRFALNKPATLKLVVFGRAYCHLCDDMIAGLHALQAGTPFEIEVVDVDTDPGLEARFGERVPVLVADGAEVCHFHLDVAKVNEYLSKIR
jgi:hypothetical protein